jgi:hypothetical protein
LFRSVLLALILAAPAGALDKSAYARGLEAEQDWYRAIGVWKEVQFDAADSKTYWAAGQSILVDLWAARQYEEGLKELTYWEPRWQPDARLRQNALAWTGLFQYSLQRFPAAEYSLKQADSPLYLGLLMARTGREAAGKTLWTGLELPDPTLPLDDSRSPVLATALSMVLPGSGQAYSGHWFDAGQAFAMVGFFGFSTYAAWRYDTRVSHNYVLTGISAAITALFYASNVYGAYKTAEYYNQNKTNARYREWEDAVWKRGLPTLSPSTEK